MRTIDEKLRGLLKHKSKGYWADRVLSELEYLKEIPETANYDDRLCSAADMLSACIERNDSVTKEAALKAEEELTKLKKFAKNYSLLCAAHAHIDMNWQWRFDETVSVVLDTFRTMLDLMNEYPQFCFSQSQASVYQIVEQFDPEMLREIKKRVKQGRWEVAASAWVEADKNMPSGESQARHILYTKRYLSKLLDIDPETLNIDFEPDTFGHSANVPEILTRGGVRYYYHSRGSDEQALYRWKAPSGSSLLVFNDPLFYNGIINTGIVSMLPDFSRKYGLNTMLYVYGVGDHGGGPTIRDIERILDMGKWPLFPNIRCGIYRDFFREAEKVRESLPVIDHELNFIFTGCYTSQSRIKEANRVAEAAAYEAEAYGSIRSMVNHSPYSLRMMESAWQKLLFNQFHDILPGSGTVDTREYAMGQFQSVMAKANAIRSSSIRSIAANIDTTGVCSPAEAAASTAEGAGVAHGIGDFRVSQVCRGGGRERVFVIFNPLPVEREEMAELTLWDWDGDTSCITVRDGSGNAVPHQMLDDGRLHPTGWQQYYRILIRAKLPACGYNTFILSETEKPLVHPCALCGRTDTRPQYVLENEWIRAEFDPVSAALVSLKEKQTGREYVDTGITNGARPGGVFRYIEENTVEGMTSWRVGPYMNVSNITSNVVIRRVRNDPSLLRQNIEYEAKVKNSTLRVSVSLDQNSRALRYEATCDWFEKGLPGQRIPQLGFYMPFPYACTAYKYDIPFGVIERGDADNDRPSNGVCLAVNNTPGEKSVYVAAANKYGFRGTGNSISLSLIRSSYDPDPYPEIGMHRLLFEVGLTDGEDNKGMIGRSSRLSHPFSVISVKPGRGTLPLQKGYIKLEEGSTAVISSVKLPEENPDGRLIVRLYETAGRKTSPSIAFAEPVKKAYFTDIEENAVEAGSEIQVDGETVRLDLNAYLVATLCIEF